MGIAVNYTAEAARIADPGNTLEEHINNAVSKASQLEAAELAGLESEDEDMPPLEVARDTNTQQAPDENAVTQIVEFTGVDRATAATILIACDHDIQLTIDKCLEVMGNEEIQPGGFDMSPMPFDDDDDGPPLLEPIDGPNEQSRYQNGIHDPDREGATSPDGRAAEEEDEGPPGLETIPPPVMLTEVQVLDMLFTHCKPGLPNDKQNELVDTLVDTIQKYSHDPDVQKKLVEMENPDGQSGSLMHVASSLGYKPVVTTLKDSFQANSDLPRAVDGKTPLHLALEMQHSTVVDCVMSRNSINHTTDDGIFPLQIASNYDDHSASEAMIRTLVTQGADVNQAVLEDHGYTVLHLAVQRRQESLVSMLMPRMRDVNVASVTGLEPLHFTVIEGDDLGSSRDWRIRILRILVKKGASMEHHLPDGRLPLLAAVEGGLEDVAIELATLGADVERRTGGGSTVLHVAITAFLDKVVKVLVAKGANVNLRDTEAKTPVYLAAELLAAALETVDPTSGSRRGQGRSNLQEPPNVTRLKKIIKYMVGKENSKCVESATPGARLLAQRMVLPKKWPLGPEAPSSGRQSQGLSLAGDKEAACWKKPLGKEVRKVLLRDLHEDKSWRLPYVKILDANLSNEISNLLSLIEGRVNDEEERERIEEELRKIRVELWEPLELTIREYEKDRELLPLLRALEWDDMDVDMAQPELADAETTGHDDLKDLSIEAALKNEQGLSVLLEAAGLKEYVQIMQEEEIDMESFLELEGDADLVDIGVNEKDVESMKGLIERTKAIQTQGPVVQAARREEDVGDTDNEEEEDDENDDDCPEWVANLSTEDRLWLDETKSASRENHGNAGLGEAIPRMVDELVAALSIRGFDQAPEEVLQYISWRDATADETDVELDLSDVPECVELTRKAMNWVKDADKRLLHIFIQRLQELGEGPEAWQRSKKLCKALKGQFYTPKRFPLRESKLDKGMRILWQERSTLQTGGDNDQRLNEKHTASVLVWGVVKHDDISSEMEKIDRTFARMGPEATGQAAMSYEAMRTEKRSTLNEGVIETQEHVVVPEVILDPAGNTPLHVFKVRFPELPQLEEGTWKPPMKLTAQEERIVNKDGAVLLLGRSGTGKTVCVAMRMHRDQTRALHAKVQLKQAFVARSRALCKQVKRMVESGGNTMNQSGRRAVLDAATHEGEDQGSEVAAAVEEELVVIPPRFLTIGEFTSTLEHCVRNVRKSWPPHGRIQYHDFIKLPCWHRTKGHAEAENDSAAILSLGPHRETLSSLTLWTQIRSFIKGSAEAAWGCPRLNRRAGTPITREEYMQYTEKQCFLNEQDRSTAYDMYEAYQNHLMKTHNFGPDNFNWDDCDRTLNLLGSLLSGVGIPAGSYWPPFDRIYADEVQDSTQCEVTLMLLSCGKDANGLFLAGDTAQAVTHGVVFRFPDVRTVIHRANGKIDRPEKLWRNYRSHSGVLEFASSFLRCLEICYPRGTNKLQPDAGLAKGPRPAVWNNMAIDLLKDALALDERLVVITRDENVGRLAAQLTSEDQTHQVLGIREAKGLEFNDVLIVNFFLTATHLEKGWRKLLDFRWSSSPDESNLPKTEKQLEIEAAGLDLPSELEVDLKMLYTAITRCRNRLVLCETDQSSVWKKFIRRFKETEQQVSTHEPPKGKQATIMMPDEWRARGVQYVQNVQTDDGTQARRFLELALDSFKRAGKDCEEYVARVKASLEYMGVREKLKDMQKWQEREKLGAVAVSNLLRAGLVRDALEAMTLSCYPIDPQVVMPLRERISKLQAHWNIVAQDSPMSFDPPMVPTSGASAGASGGGL